MYRLLSKKSYDLMVSTDLRGKTHAQPGCPTCAELDESYAYGMGLVSSGSWLLQNPMFAGEAAVEAYLPAKKIAIAVAVTRDEKRAFVALWNASEIVELDLVRGTVARKLALRLYWMLRNQIDYAQLHGPYAGKPVSFCGRKTRPTA